MSVVRGSLLLALTLLVSGGGHFLSAQQGLGGRGLGLNGLGPRLGENVQMALDNQSQLDLSTQQVESLRELAAGIQTDVAPLESQINALRGQILAGEVDWTGGVLQLQELQAQYQGVAEPYRTGVVEVLTSDQHLALQTIMFETRPLAGGIWGGAAGIRPGTGAGWNAGYGIAPGRSGGRVLSRGAGRGMGGGLGVRAVRGAGRGFARGGGRGRWVYRRGIGG